MFRLTLLGIGAMNSPRFAPAGLLVGLEISPRAVEHTSHRTYGYLIAAEGRRIAWAPEFSRFPRWAEKADLMFADAAGWERPIRFAKGVGGHVAALETAQQARRRGVRRLILAHVGRPTTRAMDAGERPPFGRFGQEGEVFEPRRWRSAV